jgi:hypothetical protein
VFIETSYWFGLQGKCVLEAENVAKLLTFEEVDKDTAKGEPTLKEIRLATQLAEYTGGQFSLIYANCLAPAVQLSFDIHVALYNVRKDGITKDYLSVGEDMLPTVYMVNPSTWH